MTATTILQASPEVASSCPTRSWTRRSTALLVLVLVLSSVLIVRRIRVGEFSYNVDETQHAVTGLFVADLIRDHPLSHPKQYTYEYYAQYPALSGVLHWPPLFYGVEGLFFLILGPSVVAARLAILFFALLALTCWFLLVRELQNDWTAALATALLGALPSILLFEETVMLEIPVLALCLAATLFWARYLLRAEKLDLYLFAVLAAAALLTKQNAVYLVPFCLFSGLTLKGWRFFLKPEVLGAAALTGVLIAPFYTVVYLMHWKTIAMDLGQAPQSGSRANEFLYYWQALPGHLGWILLGLSIVGIVTSRRWESSQTLLLMLSWIVACYLTFTFIGHKEARYAIYWIPPFLYFAAGCLTCFFRTPVMRVVATVAALCVLAGVLASAWRFQRPYVSGYAAAAERVVEEKAGIVLYDGYLPGDFIFFVRSGDAGRRFMVLRKALYADRIKKSGGTVELVHSEQEIKDLMGRYGIRFVVVTEGEPLRFESQKILREMVATSDFEPLGVFPIEGTDLPAHNMKLQVFRNLKWAPPTEKFLRIKMLTLSNDIVVPLDRFSTVGP
jgi:hypothetical protein